MGFVYEDNRLATTRRGGADLFDDVAHVFRGVMRGCIKFVNIERVRFCAGRASAAGFSLFRGVLAVDSPSYEACEGGFSCSFEAAEEVGVGDFFCLTALRNPSTVWVWLLTLEKY